jgi:beta-ribofuranosylaminobenzene 5'-phosphate synthase
MIRLHAPSRLHFGLLSLFRAEHWSNGLGELIVPARQFGGAGLMIEEPGIRLTAQAAADWSAEGPLAERVLGSARRFAETLPPERVRPHRLIVESAAPEHAGLGTGTQLALAVAGALAAACGLADLDVIELARRVGRGRRSGVGIHGFGQGGFVVEAGRRAEGTIAPLVARLPFPEDWRLLVIFPPARAGLHGQREEETFASLGQGRLALDTTEALCRLVLLGMLPALRERDLDAFGEALFDFNLRSGQMFAAIQGGPYACSAVAELVAFVRRQGIRGVGQSSWGPAVFAVTADAGEAAYLAKRIEEQGGGEVVITQACNRGAW